MAPPPKYEVKRIPSVPHPGPPPIPQDEIVRKVAAAEDAALKIYDTYDFMQTIRIEEMSTPGGKFSVTGEEYTRPDGQRVWRVVVDETTGSERVGAHEALEGDALKVLHRTIAGVTEDYAALRNNTAAAKLIEYTNHLTKEGVAARAAIEPLVLMVAPLAAIDGTRLTHWRTAAASALAASYLAWADAANLAMVGAGALAPFLIEAHASQRPIREVTIWNHRAGRAEQIAADLSQRGLPVRYEPDLEKAVRGADIVSCATLSNLPLVKGDWLKPGTHLDLVGAFNLQMREADDEAVRRAELFIDTPSALTEGGDIAVAIQAGLIGREDIRATLADLAHGRHKGRSSAEAVTLFKSIGASLEDLAAATLVWRRLAPP